MSGVSQGFISQLENGQTGVTVENIMRLAAALGCEPWWDLYNVNPLVADPRRDLHGKVDQIPNDRLQLADGLLSVAISNPSP